MTIREQTEEIEKKTLHPKACLSSKSKGRLQPEEEGDIRTVFQRDRDRIIHSKSFRRLKHKTQVFLAPTGDHYRTRLTHALEVAQIARTISRALRLNEDLTEAIALGHDLGHTPFGHAGEAFLDEIVKGGFNHYEQSLRVIDFIEKDGHGLNLTMEVRDGILKHSKGKGNVFSKGEKDKAETLEGQVVRASDGIAYANHDLDDALRAGIIKEKDTPPHIIKAIGDTHSKRIDTMVRSVIYASLERDLTEITMAEDILSVTEDLRAFLFKNVYESEVTHKEFLKAKKILKDLFSYYMERPEEVFSEIPRERLGDNTERLVCDFIAGMTDRYALMTYEKLFFPQPWLVM